MKPIIFPLLLLGLYSMAWGQPTPQYPLITSSATFIGGTQILNEPKCLRNQTLYKPSEFPGAPAGMITRLYLKAGSYQTSNIPYRNFTIRMATMSAEGGVQVDTLKHTVPVSWYNTSLVYYSPSHTVYGPVDSGDWIQFTLQQPFYYDGVNNFIVEMSHDSASFQSNDWPFVMQFSSMYRAYRVTCAPYFTSNWLTPTAAVSQVNILGLDIQPNGIDDVRGLANLSLYPNPSNGVFSVSFEARRKLSEVQITVTNMTGRLVFQDERRNVDGKFTTQLDLSDMPRGIYFAEIKADGERVMRKLVVR